MRDMSVTLCPLLPESGHLLFLYSKVITRQKQFPACKLRTNPVLQLNIRGHLFKQQKNGWKNDQQNDGIIKRS